MADLQKTSAERGYCTCKATNLHLQEICVTQEDERYNSRIVRRNGPRFFLPEYMVMSSVMITTLAQQSVEPPKSYLPDLLLPRLCPSHRGDRGNLPRKAIFRRRRSNCRQPGTRKTSFLLYRHRKDKAEQWIGSLIMADISYIHT